MGWLTIDGTDDDPIRFWRHLIMALRKAGAEVGESALSAMGVPGLDPLEAAIPRLINDLVESPDSLSMVLDDFHLLRDRRIGEAVEYFVSYLPSHVRLVIGSRVDPPLPMALWRVRGMLNEIRAEHLSFDPTEAVALVSQVASMDLDSDRTRHLIEQTEGWAAGLQLTALALREADDPVSQLETTSRYQLHLNDYVLTEVIVSLTQDRRDFILRSSVLDRLSAPLCDAALGIDKSAEILEQLDETDPFLSRLGADGVWFQYHSLVRDALRRERSRLRTEEKESVLRRAASWFLENGDPEQAIRHLIEAGDTERAKELLLRHEEEFLDHGQIGTFLALADSLGSRRTSGRPGYPSGVRDDGGRGSPDRMGDIGRIGSFAESHLRPRRHADSESSWADQSPGR